MFFEDHTLDIDRRELSRGSKRIEIEPQVFDLLVYLVQNRDRVVSKDDLVKAVWKGRIVSDSALSSRITAVRHAIGDDGEQQRLIRTVPRKGFRFVGAATASGYGGPTKTVPPVAGPEPMPALMLSALQVNLAGGRLPPPESDDRRYLKIPLNAFPGASWGSHAP